MKRQTYYINQPVKLQVSGKNWDDDYIADGIIIGINPDYVLNGKVVYIVRLVHDENSIFNVTADQFVK